MNSVRFSNTDRILDPCKDIIFKLLFTRETRNSRNALNSLTSAFMERKTQIITITANEPPASNFADRQIRYDIACKLDGGELANIEMTMNPKIFEAARLEYHIARLYINQDIKGVDASFGDLMRVYQISLFVERNLYPDAEFVHHFKYYDPQRGTSLGGQTEIITVELKKVQGILVKPVKKMSVQERWAVFFRYGSEKDRRPLINELMAEEEGIAMAGAELLTVSEDERTRTLQMLKELYELDVQSDRVEARREARRQGRAEGLEEGRAEGYNKAKAEFQEEIRLLCEQLEKKQ
jgi:predicted transposase/invertase (TIGR01784 family)